MDFKAFYLRKKFWLNDFLHGSRLWNQYCDVMQIIGGVKPEKKREDKLKKLLEYTVNNVPYYQSFVTSQRLRDFPVVNKQIYLSDYDAFCVPIDKIPGQRGILHIQETSGSTGTPFKVRQDTNCRLRRIAIIKSENEKIGFHSFMSMMHIRCLSNHYSQMPELSFNGKLRIWYADNYNLNSDRIVRIVNTINQHHIRFVRGYMTSIDTITRYMEENNMKFDHEITFISVGELLQEWLRIRVMEYLHCNIISQYGNEENGIFGQSDINGSGRHINLNGAGCIVEILKIDSDEPAEKGEIGRIVVTDLTNYAFPMIRYEIGDLAAPCEYYSDGTIKSIDNLSGRITDMVYRTNGEVVDFINSIPNSIYKNPYIAQFQFIQNDSKEYTLRLSIRDDRAKESRPDILSSMQNVLGYDANITIEWLNELPVLNSGKRKIIVNEWKNKK